MSIEQSIDNVAGGLNAIAAAINNVALALAGKTPTTGAALGNVGGPGAQANKSATTKSQSAATAPADTPPTATAQEVAQETKAGSSAEEPDSAIDFEKQIQKPIVALANGGRRAEAVAILNKFGVKKASELKPEQYPAALAAILALG